MKGVIVLVCEWPQPEPVSPVLVSPIHQTLNDAVAKLGGTLHMEEIHVAIDEAAEKVLAIFEVEEGSPE